MNRLILCSIFACCFHSVANALDPGQTAPPKQPNVVLINLDDADYRMFESDALSLFPNLQKLAGQGVRFTNLHVTTPFCGPSRASLFRGQYAHRTGVRVNIPESDLSMGFRGGYREFLRQGHQNDELGVWMQNAGYRTIMIGKYHHNGFDFKIPPGWNDFYMSNGGRYFGTYRFTNGDAAEGSHSRNAEDKYRTTQECEDAVRIIRQHHSSKVNQPLFLYFAPLGPHRPSNRDFTRMVDKEVYGDWQSRLRIPWSPDFNYSHSDKPAHRQVPPFSDTLIETMHREHLSRTRAVKSVDDAIGKIVAALAEAGTLENTYVFVTSDNGYFLGQHRLHNKLEPLTNATRVPLFAVGPGVHQGTLDNHLLAHIDLCPTIMEIAGLKPKDFFDGSSFAHLLSDTFPSQGRTPRKSVLIENWQLKRNPGRVLPGMYSALRQFDSLYVEWATGDKEFYDLAKDPFELENIYKRLNVQTKTRLKRELREARNVEMSPIVTILAKKLTTSEEASPGAIHGCAEDDSLIKLVELTIKDTDSNAFWNGTKWQNDAVILRATLPSEPGIVPPKPVEQRMVRWQFAKDKSFDGRRLVVSAWAFDEKGNRSAPFQQQVSFVAPSPNH